MSLASVANHNPRHLAAARAASAAMDAPAPVLVDATAQDALARVLRALVEAPSG